MCKTLQWVTLLAVAMMSSQPLTVRGQPDATSTAQKPSSNQDENLSAGVSQAAGRKLSVCVLTADFWGLLKSPQERGRTTLKGGGGTATAFHLLATLLKQQPGVTVTFLGVTKDIVACTQAQKVMIHCHTLLLMRMPQLTGMKPCYQLETSNCTRVLCE